MHKDSSICTKSAYTLNLTDPCCSYTLRLKVTGT